MIRKKISNLLFLFLFICACSGRQQSPELRVRLSQDPESLNPVQYHSVTATQLLSLVYQSLLVVDLETRQYKPLLVEALPKPLTRGEQTFYTFHLRPEARWDNGQPVTAADVVFSLKVIHSPGLQNQRLKSFFGFIQDVLPDTANPRKFTLVCGKYIPDEILQIEQFAVLPEYLVDPRGLLRPFTYRQLAQKADSLAQVPALQEFATWFNSDRFTRNKDFLKGSGGYELRQWQTGQYVALQKKKNWWGDQVKPALPYLTAKPENIVFRVIPDNATALLALRNSQLDVLADLPVSAYQQLARDAAFTRQYQLFTPATYDFTYLGLNARNPKLADARTRQALAHLLDVDKIMQATQSGFATRTIGPIHPADTRYYNRQLQPFAFDTARAQALLQAAGWEKQSQGWRKNIQGRWVPLRLTLNYKAGNTEFESIALIFQQAAASIRIPVSIQPVEGLLLTNNLKNHQFELFLRYLSGNPFFFNFKPILHTESAAPGGGNYTAFGTPESDRLIDQVNQTDNAQTRARLLQRLQAILHQESNLIFLYFNKDRLAVHKRFTNLKVSGIKPGYDLSAFTLKAEN
ncbi:MAG: ABC transporter substrate-binding protein [Adhaeribacter sp.]